MPTTLPNWIGYTYLYAASKEISEAILAHPNCSWLLENLALKDSGELYENFYNSIFSKKTKQNRFLFSHRVLVLSINFEGRYVQSINQRLGQYRIPRLHNFLSGRSKLFFLLRFPGNGNKVILFYVSRA